MRIDLVFEPGWPRVTELPALHLAVAEDTHSFATPDDMMWRVGYAALDDRGRFLRSGEHAVGGGECLAFNVAGTSHRRDAVQDPGFAPGSAVLLRPEPSNPHDADAVGIWDRSGTIKAGFVPRALSATVAASFRGGLPLGGAILSEFRLHSRSGQRVGLQIVVAPAAALRLDVHRSSDLAFTTSIDLREVMVAAPAAFGLQVSDPRRGLTEALHLLGEKPEALVFIAAAAVGSDCAVLFGVPTNDLGGPARMQALVKLAREPNTAQRAELMQGGWTQHDINGTWWSAEAALTDASAVARVADAALMTLFRVFGATGVLKIASDLEPERFAQILRSRGVALVAGS